MAGAFAIIATMILAGCESPIVTPPTLTCDSDDARSQVIADVFGAAEIFIQVRSVLSWGRLGAIRDELNGLKRQNAVVLSSAHAGIGPGNPGVNCQEARGVMTQDCVATYNNGVIISCLGEISLILPPQDRSDKAREALAILAKRSDVGLFPPKGMANGVVRLKAAYFRMIENRQTVSLVDQTEDFYRLADGVLLLAMERATLLGGSSPPRR
ncbi:MAG: hypothetical protein ACR2F8_12860 [Caulobacteraceae bacterium]